MILLLLLLLVLLALMVDKLEKLLVLNLVTWCLLLLLHHHIHLHLGNCWCVHEGIAAFRLDFFNFSYWWKT
ncbi:hypothetical protein BDR26DRAFT_871679 [Obelidium mucronatum]|nr:hypothetical protein BDR26DRAFT_871679 [Obelidium mucronatum]